MSEREGFRILDSQNAAAVGCNYKVLEAARPCPQILPRRQLTDISNLPQTGKPLIEGQKSQSIPATTKEYIEQLQKENLALAKILAQRNKIIEQTGIELQRLRANLIKMRDQNQQLALSHTHMLAELNLGKDKLKALQHELGCKNGLLQGRNSKLEVNLIKEDEPSKDGEDHEKPRNAKKRLRSLSLGSSEQLQSEDNVGNRLPVRRQSARFKAVKDGDSLSETDDSKCLLPDGTAPSTSVDTSANNEDHVANRPRSSVRRQSARFKTVSPCPLSDETVQETNGSTSVEMSVIIEDHAVQRPSVRRQSTRLKTATPCPMSDETVQENNESTSVETSVIIEGHTVQRPSVRRQSTSTRCKVKTAKQADDPSEMDDTVSTNCSLPDEPIPENGSTTVETSVLIEEPAVQRPSRRQAIRCKAKTPKQADDPSEMDDSMPTNSSIPHEPIPENGSTSVEKLVKGEDDSSCSGQRRESQEPSLDRPSLGRPSRVAARKVQTYREVSLRVKMRRPN